MGRHEQLPPWAVTSNCRHGPPRAIPLQTCRGLRRAEEKDQPGWRRPFECFDRRPDISLYHGELRRAIKELEDDVLSCRSGEAATTARVSPPSRTGVSRELRGPRRGTELFSGGRNETSRTGPNAQPDFACSASKETRKMSEPSDFMVRWTSSVD